MVKPAIGEEEMSIRIRRDDRGGWGERALKDRPRYPGDPFRGSSAVVPDDQGMAGSHNRHGCGSGSRNGS